MNMNFFQSGSSLYIFLFTHHSLYIKPYSPEFGLRLQLTYFHFRLILDYYIIQLIAWSKNVQEFVKNLHHKICQARDDVFKCFHLFCATKDIQFTIV